MTVFPKHNSFELFTILSVVTRDVTRFAMKRVDREWMYKRLDDQKNVTPEFKNGLMEFFEHAQEQEDFIRVNRMRCPCQKCVNMKILNPVVVCHHLYTKGFCPNYFLWAYHGEVYRFNDVKTHVSEKGRKKRLRQQTEENVFVWRKKRKADHMHCTPSSWSGSCSTGASYAPSIAPEMQTQLENQAYLDKKVADECRRLLDETMKAQQVMKADLDECHESIIKERENFAEEGHKFWDAITKNWQESTKFQGEMISRWEQILKSMPECINNNNSLTLPCRESRDPRQPSDGGSNCGGAGI